MDGIYYDTPEGKALQGRNMALSQGSNSAMKFSDVNADNVLDYLSQKGDSASQDYLIKYYLDQLSESSARGYNSQREDTAYQRLMSDLQKAGISPYALTPGLTPINGSSGFTASGNTYTSARNTEYSKSMDAAGKFTQIFASVLSAIAVAFIMAA